MAFRYHYHVMTQVVRAADMGGELKLERPTGAPADAFVAHITQSSILFGTAVVFTLLWTWSEQIPEGGA